MKTAVIIIVALVVYAWIQVVFEPFVIDTVCRELVKCGG